MSEQGQRKTLQDKIWAIADDVRGAVDGWDFKQYVLGLLFYRFISENFKHASENGTELNEALSKMSSLNPKYRTKKHDVFRKISDLVEKFKGIGGEI